MMNLDYAQAARSAAAQDAEVKVYGPDAFAAMRKAGRLAAEALDMLVPHVRPGVTTLRLDELVFQFAMDHKALPATLNYKGYTKSICTSINHVVCHGIPGPKPLREGDILNIDVTLIVDGWHGDTSRMYGVGEISRKAQRLIDITFECLMRGITAVKPGGTTGDIGAAIESYARMERCAVVEDFCGHGLGPMFHDRPNILHYRVSHEGEDHGPGMILKPGMLFTIEPMINLGKPFVKVLADGWTAVTRDRELSAQFEHTVGVTKEGCEVFTYSPRGWHKPPYQLAG
jgi:methionyl aminopeptidase